MPESQTLLSMPFRRLRRTVFLSAAMMLSFSALSLAGSIEANSAYEALKAEAAIAFVAVMKMN